MSDQQIEPLSRLARHPRAAEGPRDTMSADRIVQGRRSKATRITWCPSCETDVGVWQTSFANHRSEYSHQQTPKIAIHRNADGQRCDQSGYAVNPNVVFERTAQ
jgi:hypothetical protein